MISCPRFGQPMGWFPGRLGRVTGLSIAHDGGGGARTGGGVSLCRLPCCCHNGWPRVPGSVSGVGRVVNCVRARTIKVRRGKSWDATDGKRARSLRTRLETKQYGENRSDQKISVRCGAGGSSGDQRRRTGEETWTKRGSAAEPAC